MNIEVITYDQGELGRFWQLLPSDKELASLSATLTLRPAWRTMYVPLPMLPPL